jgi:hypothetical protein
MKDVVIGGKYKHFKGNYYRVVCVARDADNPAKFFVVYQALYDSDEFGLSQVWVRDKSEFLSNKALTDGSIVQRFTLVKE